MSTRRPLALVNGVISELPVGDLLASNSVPAGGSAPAQIDADLLAGTNTEQRTLSAAQARKSFDFWHRFGTSFHREADGRIWLNFNLNTLHGQNLPDPCAPFKLYASGAGASAFGDSYGQSSVRALNTGSTSSGYAGGDLSQYGTGHGSGAYGTKYRLGTIINSGYRYETWEYWQMYHKTSDWANQIGFRIIEGNLVSIIHVAAGVTTESPTYALTVPWAQGTLNYDLANVIVLETTIGGTSSLYVNDVLVLSLSTGWWSDAPSQMLPEFRFSKHTGTTQSELEILALHFGNSNK